MHKPMISAILLNVGYCGTMQNPGTWQCLSPQHFKFLSRSGGKARTGLPGLHLQTPWLNSSASAWPDRQTCGSWLWPPGYRAARAVKGTAPAAAGLPTSSFCCEAQGSQHALFFTSAQLSLPIRNPSLPIHGPATDFQTQKCFWDPTTSNLLDLFNSSLLTRKSSEKFLNEDLLFELLF